MQKTNNELLKKRIEQNYADFKAGALLLSEEDVYDMAGRITAVEDTYYQMTEYEYLDEDEAGYLLQFHDPLEMIADFLMKRISSQPVEIDEVLCELFEQEDNEDNYITAELADELKRKHGSGVSLKAALLLETIEAGKKYVRLLQLSKDTDDEGVDFCIDLE